MVGAVADDGIRAYDARLVDAGSHRAIIGPTAVPGVVVHELTQARDERGALAALELAECPFEPRRIFAVYDVPSESRAGRARPPCVPSVPRLPGGQPDVPRRRRKLARTRSTSTGRRSGLHIPPMVWGTQWRYTRDAVLLVLASHPYDAGRLHPRLRRVSRARPGLGHGSAASPVSAGGRRWASMITRAGSATAIVAPTAIASTPMSL